MTQPRRSTGPRIQKVSQKRESAPDSSAHGTLVKEDATLCRRVALDSDPRTLIAQVKDSEPRTLIAPESRDSEPRTLIARESSEDAPPSNDEGPATVLWTKASIEVRVRGLVTPPDGTPLPTAPVQTKLSARDVKPSAKPVAKVSVRPSAPPPVAAATAAPRMTPPSFLPKSSASVMPQPPVPVPSTFPLAQARASHAPRLSPPPPAPSSPPPPPAHSAHVGLTPMQKLMMQRAQQLHDAKQASHAPPMSQPMSQHPMQQPMSRPPMSQPMSQQPMSQHPYSAHPSQMPRASQMPHAHHGSISPVAMDPSGVNTSYAPMAHQQVQPASERGSTIAKLAAVLVFAAIGLFILRGSIGGVAAPAAQEPTQPVAAAQPIPTVQQGQLAPTQPMAVPSAWMAPTPTIIPPGMVTDPRAPAPQTVATVAPATADGQNGAVAPVKKKSVKRRVEPVANPTAPAPAPVDLPGETPEPTPATAPTPVPATPAVAPPAPGPTMKNMPTKTATPTKTEGDAAQQTLDQAKFETTDAL